MTSTERQRAVDRERYRRRMEALTVEERRALWREKAKRKYWNGRQPHDPKYRHVDHASHCPECSTPIVVTNTPYRARKYCSTTCSNRASGRARDRQATTPSRLSRRQRARLAPGLTEHQRCRLLRRWRRQGRTCTYCPGPAATVDHVVPLIRGGTNWEGNLTPCCRRCNSSKADRFLVEWRRMVNP